MKQWLSFGGVQTKDFQCWISGSGTYAAPERDITVTSVPGRNGTLVYDNGRYNNIEVSYPAFILRGFEVNIQTLRNALTSKTGYQRIEDTYHPSEYRMGYLSGGFNPDVGQNLRYATFDIVFNCKPQRFLKSGEQWITMTSGQSINNPTSFSAKPIIRVTGSGTLNVGSTYLTIKSFGRDYMDIDCDLMDCYYGVENLNSYVTGDTFPVLSPGNTGVTFSSGMTVKIMPRWWIL